VVTGDGCGTEWAAGRESVRAGGREDDGGGGAMSRCS
jgi:hypothetical protein